MLKDFDSELSLDEGELWEVPAVWTVTHPDRKNPKQQIRLNVRSMTFGPFIELDSLLTLSAKRSIRQVPFPGAIRQLVRFAGFSFSREGFLDSH